MLIVKNDEQIKVGVTAGLTAGSSSFTFDGTNETQDYRNQDIVISEIGGRGIMIKGVDYSWNFETGTFTLLQLGDVLSQDQWYNVHFQILPGTPQSDTYSLVNSSYFIRAINIPNLTNPAILERLNSFISQFEPICLEKILGYNLYKALKYENSQRITDLVYGVEYEDAIGEIRKWQGLIHGNYESLVAYYVYYYFQDSSATQTTGISTAAMKSEAGQSVSPADKMIFAWNMFSAETESMCYFLWMRKDISRQRVYPDFTANQYLQTQRISRKNNVFGI